MVTRLGDDMHLYESMYSYFGFKAEEVKEPSTNNMVQRLNHYISEAEEKILLEKVLGLRILD